MAKGKKTKRGDPVLVATDSRPSPAAFPPRSLESRAAARALLQGMGPRPGDTGIDEDGFLYVWCQGPGGRLVKLVVDL